MDKYFIYDPENNGFETYATLAEQKKAAKEIIDSYLDCDGWLEEVTGIMSGIITEKATKCDIINRPKNLGDKNFDENCVYWPEHVKYTCNYKMAPIIIHGKTCNKVEHVGIGYLHDANDDTAYDVDGCIYCGRCHRAID